MGCCRCDSAEFFCHVLLLDETEFPIEIRVSMQQLVSLLELVAVLFSVSRLSYCFPIVYVLERSEIFVTQHAVLWSLYILPILSFHRIFPNYCTYLYTVTVYRDLAFSKTFIMCLSCPESSRLRFDQLDVHFAVFVVCFRVVFTWSLRFYIHKHRFCLRFSSQMHLVLFRGSI